MDLQRILNEGLELLLDLMGGCDYEDCETILRVIDKYLPDYDMSRSDNGPSLAYSLTERYIRRDSCFRYLLNQPGMYDFFEGDTGCAGAGAGG